MQTELMHNALTGSLAGQLTFPQVIAMLTQAGVESYRIDFITGTDVFYLPNGRTHAEPIPSGPAAIAEHFSSDQLTAAIRGAQSDTIRYPEFVSRCHTAGVAAYQVFLTGRRVIYFGRQGDLHTEHFPQ